MRGFFLLSSCCFLLLPAAAAELVRITAHVATPHRGKPYHRCWGVCSVTDDPTQCLALIDLHNSTNGDEWGASKGWLKGASYCGWHGVTCDSSANVLAL